MSTAVTSAVAALVAAINTVPNLQGYRGDELAKIQLPAGVVGLPELNWTTYCTDPNEGRFPVALLVVLGEGALDSLAALIGPFAEALESTGGVVDPDAGAIPFSMDFGSGMVAAGYEVIVQYPLNSEE